MPIKKKIGQQVRVRRIDIKTEENKIVYIKKKKKKNKKKYLVRSLKFWIKRKG